MSGLRTMRDFLAEWAGELHKSFESLGLGGDDRNIALQACLVSSAKEQAECVFLILDAIPVEQRDFNEAERLIEAAGLEFVIAWVNLISIFDADRESWAEEAVDAAAQAYRGRLNELAASLHAGGRA